MSPEPEKAERELSSLEQKLILLSNPPESAKPIESITDEEVRQLRYVLKKSGFELDLPIHALVALGSKQFRSLNQGKGIAVLESLGSNKAKSLMMTCEQLADTSGNFPLDIYGLRLTIGSLLALAVRPAESRAKIIENLNQRVFLGYSDAEREVAKVAFAKIPKVDNPDKASIQVGGVMKIFEAIVNLSK